MVEVAATEALLAQADALVAWKYGSKGYKVPPRPEGITLVMQRNGAVCGTLTVVKDRPLACEELYPEVVEKLVQLGRKPAEVVRFASSRLKLSELRGLFRAAHEMNEGVDDVLIEVNPTHEQFYRLFGFDKAGPQRTCERVAAPAVLMRLMLR